MQTPAKYTTQPKELAENFKSEGHFDEIRQEIQANFQENHHQELKERVLKACNEYVAVDQSAHRVDHSTLQRRITKEVSFTMNSYFDRLKKDVETSLISSDEYREKIRDKLESMLSSN